MAKKNIYRIGVSSITRGNDNRIYENYSEKSFDNKKDAIAYGRKCVKPFDSKTGEYNKVFFYKNGKLEM